MYDIKSYINRSMVFLNNQVFPSSKKLSTLMIYATDLCDSGCKHCLIWAKRPVKHLPYDKIIEIMNSKCVTKNTMVGLEGGEFLLHPDALKIMKWFSKNHPNFDLLSNCLKPDSLIEAVHKYPPKRLYISLDGTKETYLYMRGKDGYDNVRRVIKECKDVVPISTMFTLSPYNDFNDLNHVAEVCKSEGVDMRVGVYNDIAFFDTVEKAHETGIGLVKEETVLNYQGVKKLKEEGVFDKNKELKQQERLDISVPKHNTDTLFTEFKSKIPAIVQEFSENYDFLVLYDEWRRKNVKIKCFSILDSLVILPNGDVPICQNLDLKIGNVNNKSLDEIFNSTETQKIHKDYVNNCNQCWINFHRKYDIVLYRTFEKYFGKTVTGKLFGYYQWEDDKKATYSKVMKRMDKINQTIAAN